MTAEAGVLAPHTLDDPADRGHRGGQIGRRIAASKIVDLLEHGARLQGRRADDHFRRRGQQHERECIALAAFLDDAAGELLRLIEPAAIGRPVGHREGGVDHQHTMRPSADGAREPGPLQVRLRHGQHQQHDQECANGQQEPLLEPQSPAAPLQGRQQIFHGRP